MIPIFLPPSHQLISEFRRGNGDKLAAFIQHSKLVLEIRQELLELQTNPLPLSQVFAVKGWYWTRSRGHDD